MRIHTILLILLTSLHTGFGQAFVKCQNGSTATILTNTGTAAGFLAVNDPYLFGVYVAPDGTPDGGNFILAGTVSNSFAVGRIGVLQPSVAVPNNTGQTIAVQVRGWPRRAGASYEEAALLSGNLMGKSPVISITPNMVSNSAPNIFSAVSGLSTGFELRPFTNAVWQATNAGFMVQFTNTDSTLVLTNAGGVSGPVATNDPYSFGLYLAAAGTTEESLFKLAATTTNMPGRNGRFGVPSQIGTFVSAEPGKPIAYQIRGWRTSVGLTYEEARKHDWGLLGKSTIGTLLPGTNASSSPAVFGQGDFAGQITGGLLLSSNVPDFTVVTTADSTVFQINGVNAPTLTLVRGGLYIFSVNVNAGGHMFRINSPGVTGPDGAAYWNYTAQGKLTYQVPTNASNYTYDCFIHGASMQGDILTVPPPPPAVPPPPPIVGFQVGTNVVVRSLGTNSFSLLPEYSTNLSSTNWFRLSVQQYRFLGGTNETICGRPPGSNVFIRLRAQ